MSAIKTKSPVSQSLLYGATFLASATSPGMAIENVMPMQTVRVPSASGDRPFHNHVRIRSSQWAQWAALFKDSGTGAEHSIVPCWVEPEWEEASFTGRSPEPPLDSSDAVATIRASLSLQIKELAIVLGVERPTIYAWLRGTVRPQPQNLARIAELLDLSKLWNSLTKRPVGSAVRNTLGSESKTLVTLLAERDLDRNAIQLHMRNIAAQQRDRPKGIHEIAKERGIDLSTIRESQSEFDVITGKPFDED